MSETNATVVGRQGGQAKGGKQPKQPKKAKDPIEESMKTAMGRLKVRVAEDLGLIEKVRKEGWGGLSAAETGRLGGIMTRTLREQERKAAGQESV